MDAPFVRVSFILGPQLFPLDSSMVSCPPASPVPLYRATPFSLDASMVTIPASVLPEVVPGNVMQTGPVATPGGKHPVRECPICNQSVRVVSE